MIKNLAVLALALGLCGFCNQAIAGGIGYIDYIKVQENFAFAQAAQKELSSKQLELQQFVIDKEKQYKMLDTPLKKQNFEDATAKELRAKEEALVKLRAQKAEQTYNKIQAATKQVLVEQKLDAILLTEAIFIGGVDITDLVIQKLKTGTF